MRSVMSIWSDDDDTKLINFSYVDLMTSKAEKIVISAV